MGFVRIHATKRLQQPFVAYENKGVTMEFLIAPCSSCRTLTDGLRKSNQRLVRELKNDFVLGEYDLVNIVCGGKLNHRGISK